MRRLKYLLIGAASLAVIATSISFSFWSYTDETGDKEAVQDLRVDKIFENYKTIQADLGATRLSDKTFTVYVFPSAEYFQVYKSYLEGKTSVLPEDLAGYIQPVLNDDGTVKKDVDGDTIYNIHRDLPTQQIENTTISYTTQNGNGSSTFPTDAYVRHLQTYVTDYDQAISKSFIPDYTMVNDAIDKNDRSYSTPTQKDRVYKTYEFFINRTSNKRTYGAPSDKPINWDTEGSQINFLPDGRGEDGYKILFPSDRFGYWQNLTMEEGRFLPIKIDVVNSLSPTAFMDSIGPINTSMNDGNPSPWYDMSISGFTYVDHNKPSIDNSGVQRSYTIPYANLTKSKLPGYSQVSGSQYIGNYLDILPRDFFGTYDLNNIFDFTQVLSNYADENGIVRLFPTFSNGKGYWAGKVGLNEFGGRDGVKFETVQYDPNDQAFKNEFPWPLAPNSDKNKAWTEISTVQTPSYSPRYATFDTSNPTKPNQGTMKVYMATLTNVPINVGGKNTRIRIRIAPAFGSSQWNSGWFYTYDLDFGQETKFKDLHPGNYNFYLFQGDSGEANSGYSNTFNNINGLFETQFPGGNVYQFFPELSGKKLINVRYKEPGNYAYAEDLNSVDYNLGGGEYALNTDGKTSSSSNKRPIYLLMQKATEPKIYTDLNPDFHTTEEIQQQVNDQYPVAYSGYTLERPVYKKEGNNLTRIFTKQNDPNKTLDNCYLFNGVDFTDVNYDYFQFRFTNIYDPIIHIGSDPSNINWPIYMNLNNKPLNYVQSSEYPTLNDYLGTNAVAFYPMSHLFGEGQTQNPFMLNEVQGSVDLSRFMKIFEEDARGIYDMLFVPYGEPTAQGVTFNVYLHRHTNIFIKLFEHKVNSEYIPQDKENTNHSKFIDHDTVDPNNELLWRKSFYIGDSVKPGSKSIIKNNNKTLQKALKDYINKIEPGGDENKFLKYVVKDQVTDAPICYFKIGDNGKAKLIVTPEFRVIKNYIWYITTWK